MLPDWFYYSVFCPSNPAEERGALIYANYGRRKVEAALLASGFQRDELIVAHADHFDKVISEDTKILSISTNDPLGIGPATSTFIELRGGEGRMAVKLRELLQKELIKKCKPKIFLGGPGAWQLAINPGKRKELVIDCVVIGEGEVTGPRLFKQAMENHYPIPEVVEAEVAPTVTANSGTDRKRCRTTPGFLPVPVLPLGKNSFDQYHRTSF